MNKIDYNIGILHRLAAGAINNKPYVMLDDVEYILRNSGVYQDTNNIFERRTAKWPSYYDPIEVENYGEWYIKGTNIKLGFDYIDVKSNEHYYYCIVTNSYDNMDLYDSEKELLEHFNYIVQNENFSWQYND